MTDVDDTWNNDQNALTLTGNAHNTLFRIDAATNKSDGRNRTQQTDNVHFTNPVGVIPDTNVLTDVDETSKSSSTAWRAEIGQGFTFDGEKGLFVPSLIGGQYKNSSEADASLNGARILHETDDYNIDTLGARVGAKWNDKLSVSGLWLRNTGDVESNQENEYAGRIVVAPASWLTVGGKIEQFDGAKRFGGAVLIGKGSNVDTLDDLFETQQRFRETPWTNTETQRNEIFEKKALKAGQKGVLVYGGAGEFNSQGGDYAQLGTAFSLTDNLELQAEFNRWCTENRDDHMNGRSFKIGPTAKLPWLDMDVGLKFVREHDEQMGDSNRLELGISVPLWGQVRSYLAYLL
jgi:hypothetical protein